MKTNTIFIFIFSLLILAVSVAFAWYVQDSLLKKIEVVRDHHIKEEQNKNLEFGNQLKMNMETLIEQEQTIKEAFLNSNEVVGFITDLESHAQVLGLVVSIEKVEYGTEEMIEGVYAIKPITFAIQLTGTYPQMEAFVSNLTQLEKILLIKELKLYKGGEIESTYTTRIIIQGTTISS